MSRSTFLKLGVSIAVLCGLPLQALADGSPADVIFFGGPIITINDLAPTAEAVAVRDGKIVAVGEKAALLSANSGPATVLYDLKGATMTPGFVDGHSHFMDSLAAAGRANISAPPAGKANNPQEIVAELKTFAEKTGLKPGELLVGYGFDENLMPKGNELTRDVLDAAFPDNPVAVIHVSSHGAVLNSKAFEEFGYTDGMAVPAGGVIAKDANGRLTGMVMETGYLQTYAKLPIPTEVNELEAVKAGQAIYAAAGVTTVQEGATHANQLEQLQRLQAADALYLDIVAYPFMTDLGPILEKNSPSTFGTYGGHLKLGGCKILTDGSPQGKTAFFTTPYLTGGPGGETNWVGEPTAPQADINAVVKTCYDNNLPVLFHANGDAGIDMLIAAHEANAAGSLSADRRTTAIHAQFVRPDQIAKFAEYKIIPSAFTEHTFFFGDTHVLNRGMEQAAFMSPMKAYYEAGLRPANHTDYAVAPVDQMMTIWTAVNRVSRSGVVIGPEQRISPLDALKAITINGAYIYREEDSKGSIEVGKRADLVVLSDNPLTVDPMAIKDIKVLETIKDGKSVYKAQ